MKLDHECRVSDPGRLGSEVRAWSVVVNEPC